jgi:hypothetical protein
MSNYGILEYAENVVKRSLNYYENMNENNFHMVAGFTSELTDELLTALEKNDITNILEELGDATFFNVGNMIHNGFLEKFSQKISETDTLLLDLGFDWNDEDFARKLTPEEKKSYFNNVLFTKADRIRGKYPIGIYEDKQAGKFKVRISVEGKQKHIGQSYLSIY